MRGGEIIEIVKGGVFWQEENTRVCGMDIRPRGGKQTEKRPRDGFFGVGYGKDEGDLAFASC